MKRYPDGIAVSGIEGWLQKLKFGAVVEEENEVPSFNTRDQPTLNRTLLTGNRPTVTSLIRRVSRNSCGESSTGRLGTDVGGFKRVSQKIIVKDVLVTPE